MGRSRTLFVRTARIESPTDVDTGQFKLAARHGTIGQSCAPIIRGCLAYLDRTVAGVVVSGDHTLFIGQVQSVSATDGQPLLYFDGAYRTLASVPVDPVNL